MSLIKQVNFNPANQSAFGVLQTDKRTPIIQGDFVFGYNVQHWRYSYTFTVTDPATDPVAGDVYSENNQYFTVVYVSGTTLVAYGTGNPSASGNLTRITGSGTTPIAFSAYTVAAGVVSGTGATVDTNASRARIQSGTASAGYAFIQSRKTIRYRAGQGTDILLTPLFTSGVANNIQLWGIGGMSGTSIVDGYFWGYNGTSFGIAHYNAGSPTWYSQSADWNGDKVNGAAGTSFTLDPTKGYPMLIKYPFLGYGDILFFIQRPTDGAWVLVHTIRYAGSSASVQITNPTMRLTGYTINSGNTSNVTMYTASYGAFASGELNFVGNPKWTAGSSDSSVTTENNILTLRNCNTYNTVNNRGLIRLQSVTVASSAASGTATFYLTLGAALGGTPSYTPRNGSTADNGASITSGNSIASFDVAGTTVTGGLRQWSLAVDNPNSTVVDLTAADIYIAPGEIMTLSGESSATSTIGGTLNWSEDI